MKYLVENYHCPEQHFGHILKHNMPRLQVEYQPVGIFGKNKDYDDNQIKEIDQEVIQLFDSSFKSNSNGIIVFRNLEQCKFNEMESIHNIVDRSRFKDNFIFQFASADDEVTKYYHRWCEQTSRTPVKTYFFNGCQLSHQPRWPDGRSPSFDTYQRSKIFNCLNYGIRYHRTKVIADIFLNDLLGKGYVSYADTELPEHISNGIHCLMGEEYIDEFYRANKNLFPLKLNAEKIDLEKFVNRCSWNDQTFDMIEDSYVTVCVESFSYSFLTNVDVVNNDILKFSKQDTFNKSEGLFPGNSCITEKCYRPFHVGSLGLFHSTYNSLDKLRYSYDLFDDIIDHSYDMIKDDTLRHEAFMEELKRLCNISRPDWAKIYKSTLTRRKNNFINRMRIFNASQSPELFINYHYGQDPENTYNKYFL